MAGQYADLNWLRCTPSYLHHASPWHCHYENYYISKLNASCSSPWHARSLHSVFSLQTQFVLSTCSVHQYCPARPEQQLFRIWPDPNRMVDVYDLQYFCEVLPFKLQSKVLTLKSCHKVKYCLCCHQVKYCYWSHKVNYLPMQCLTNYIFQIENCIIRF